MIRRARLVALLGLFLTASADAREAIHIVGSSTVFPFAAAVAEHFGESGEFKTPRVESLGSGGGMKLFCAGVGVNHPDLVNTSRAITVEEFGRCQTHGVTEIVEVKFGYDGIVVANDKSSPRLALTLRDLYLALAAEVPNPGGTGFIPNPHKTWQDVNPALPAVKIEVLGPPPTSGTRDAFVALALTRGCRTFDQARALESEDPERYRLLCQRIREDGAWLDAGENDNLIVRKLVANKDLVGVFGYNFLAQNSDEIQGAFINGVAPTFDSIADGAYPVARPLYFYVKKAHVGHIPGMAEYVAMFAKDEVSGDEGLLIDKGLVPLSGPERNAMVQRALNLVPLLHGSGVGACWEPGQCKCDDGTCGEACCR